MTAEMTYVFMCGCHLGISEPLTRGHVHRNTDSITARDLTFYNYSRRYSFAVEMRAVRLCVPRLAVRFPWLSLNLSGLRGRVECGCLPVYCDSAYLRASYDTENLVRVLRYS